MKTVTFDETKYKLMPIRPTEEITHAAAWVDGIKFINGQIAWTDVERIYAAMISGFRGEFGSEMTHLSEVAKIVEHALSGNAESVRNYAVLLLEKLREEGDERAARIIEVKLGMRDPGPPIYPQSVAP